LRIGPALASWTDWIAFAGVTLAAGAIPRSDANAVVATDIATAAIGSHIL
jgi:hypothetical protein